ncbi:TatD family hydrolase [Thiomicrorhabdus aquaedulcis]|uniref:TatD family hydrolase n=1 Tax=Thiomicrorhabdus aquaedulcis TaxID=2211106 RepID=UPI000FDA3FC3|nr:TatD family hydrolase [Thiomicrorhabdus aquaedulcis]
MSIIVDTHCHLDVFPSPVFHQQSAEFLSIHLSPIFLTMGVSRSNWLTILQLSNKYPNVYASLGIHPWYVNDESLVDLLELRHLLSQYSVCALGEIGLDFSGDYRSSRVLQMDVFSEQLKLAEYFNKPISVHCNKAHNEMLGLLGTYRVCGVMHGLGASVPLAQRYIELGFKIGLNAVLMRANAVRYHQLVRHFGLDCFVLESDAPNVRLPGCDTSHLTDIFQVALKVAELKNRSVQAVLQQTTANARCIFDFIK